jgi:hypothetical protein
MWLRANVTLAIAVVFAVVQMFASATGGPRVGESSALASSPNGGLTRSVAAQDDNDDEDEDNDDEDDDNDDEDDDDNEDEDNDDEDDGNGDEDNDDSDNDDEDDDNEDSDNDDEDSDNDDEDSDNDDEDSDNDDEDSDNDDEDDTADDELDDELDNVDTDADIAAAPTPTPTTTAPVAQGIGTAASPSPAASPQPIVNEAQLVTTGMDATLALQTDRITVQVFSTMPAGITLKVRIVDPLLYSATPGIRAGDLIFLVEATDSMGVVLPTLPGEVNLAVKYTDVDVTGLDDTAITLGRLDPLDNTWKPAPKLLTDPATNYLAASVMDTGVYAVYVP